MSRESLTIEDQAAQAVHIADGIWELPSASCPGEIRTYNANTGFCDCPGYRPSNPGACRHGQAVGMRQTVTEPLTVTLERSIDFLRAKAARALQAELADEPPAPQPCVWCLRPEYGLGYARRTNLCPSHAGLAAEFNRRDAEYVNRMLRLDSPLLAEGRALAEEITARGHDIAERQKAAIVAA